MTYLTKKFFRTLLSEIETKQQLSTMRYMDHISFFKRLISIVWIRKLDSIFIVYLATDIKLWYLY